MAQIRVFYPEYFTNASVSEYLSMKKSIVVLQDDMQRGCDSSLILKDMSEGDLRSDALVYYTVMNSWCCLVEDICGVKSAKGLASIIWQHGLVDTISDAQLIADAIRANDSGWYVDVLPELEYYGLWQLVLDDARVEAVGILQVLCYPKRFSCKYRNMLLEDVSFNSFIGINTRHAEWTRDRSVALGVRPGAMKAFDKLSAYTAGRPVDFAVKQWIRRGFLDDRYALPIGIPSLTDRWISELRETAMCLYHGYNRLTIDGRYSSDPRAVEISEPYYPFDYQMSSVGYFSTGKFADAKDGVDKRVQYMRTHTYYHGYPLFPFVGVYKTPSESKILSVPKSYKARRIIAEEYTESAFRGQAVNKYIQDRLVAQHGQAYRRRYDPSNQDRNRILATLGSANGTYATIDMSGASDSVSEHLAQIILPPDVFSLIDSVHTDYLRVADRRLKNRILLTSGTGLTFDTESDIFLIIAITAEKVYERWTGRKPRISVTIGDDLVVDTRIYELVCELLERCGFVVNTDKSFGADTSYRESCGIEAFGGYHFSLAYYPRSGIDFSDLDNAVLKLCDLQHKFYYDYPAVAAFFSGLVKDMCPMMTCSSPGTACDDLWGREDLNPVTYPPHIFNGKVVRTKEGLTPDLEKLCRRTLHVTLVARPHRKAYEAKIRQSKYSEPVLANLEMMRYVDELKRLSGRLIASEDGEFVLIEPDDLTPDWVATTGFVIESLELR